MGHGLSIRGDSLYCPLSFSLDSYWNCLNDCWHCYLRRLNHVWGKDLRPTNIELFEKKLINGLKNSNPKSDLAWALKQKKTIRWGNKADPFQPIERKYKVSEKIFNILFELEWSFVVQTMCTEIMMDYIDWIIICKDFCFIQPIISPGAEKDWEILERKRTTPIQDRFDHLRLLKNKGVNVAVNGEPFIPGFHTLNDFEDVLKRLKSEGIKNYNTYNFHFNDFVAKRLLDIGLDIMAIWEGNQDDKWKPIQQSMIDLAKKYDIILGCPDFVNSGSYFQPVNTCCGIDVPNPSTFNVHTWKRGIQLKDNFIFPRSWDNIGNYEEGKKVFEGNTSKFYTLKDIDW